MDIPFQGKLSRDELTRIYLLGYQHIRWLNKRWFLFFFGTYFVFYLNKTVLDLNKGENILIQVLMLLWHAVAAFWPFWGPHEGARYAYKRQEAQGGFAGVINDEGLTLRTAKTTQELKWSDIFKVVRSRDLVLIYLTAQKFYFFPRAFFASDEDWQAFLSLLLGKVKQYKLWGPGGELVPRALKITAVVFLVLMNVFSISSILSVLITGKSF